MDKILCRWMEATVSCQRHHAIMLLGQSLAGLSGRMSQWAARLMVCALLWLACSGTVAAESTLFTVTGVEVDVTDSDAAKAKLKAISEAQVKAFHILVERLGDQGDAAKVAHFKPGDIGRLMASLSVEEERTGPQRYVGKLTIRFLPERVRKALFPFKIGASWCAPI